MAIYRDLNDYEIMYMVEENDDARELLFDKYRPIILNIANKYRLEAKKNGLELEDLIQEGYLGLYSAIRNYNSNENTLFYTYAMLSIRSKILNCLKMNSNQKHMCLNNSVSLTQSVSDKNDDSMVIDFIADEKSMYPDVVYEEKEFFDKFKILLFSLDINCASVLELHLNGFSNIDIAYLLDFSFKEVSNRLFKSRKKLHNYL